MSTLGLVHIAEMGGDSKAFPINGDSITPRQVIADYFDCDPFDGVADLLSSKSFKIVNRGALTPDGLDRQMDHGETILVYSHEIAKGGVPGGVVSA